MEKLDLTKVFKSYYTAKTKPSIVTIAKAQYLSIPGKGDPSEKEFESAIEALYSTAYKLKFMYKEKGKDFVVPKLEGLWWFDENKFPNRTLETSVEIPRSEWEYRLLIRIPDFVSETSIEAAKNAVIEKQPVTLASKVELYTLNEGKSVQIMHVGPFAKELETLKHLGEFMKVNDLKKNGVHHEIYLSDFRKTPEEKLRTILREPVK